MPKASIDAILAKTRARVETLRAGAAELERRAARRPVPPAFGSAVAGKTVEVVAEVKRRSPSAGVIRADLDPVAYASAYQAGGAVAVSVLTEEAHFGGSLEDLERVTRAVSIPVLRKDFIVDELQLLEARGAGAALVLLIVRALSDADLVRLARAARGLGLATVVEAHDRRELDRALAVSPTAVGVNNRDLATFVTDLAVSEALIPLVPRGVLAVAESGIEARRDVERLAACGADLVLVGEALARSGDPEGAVRALTGVTRRPR
ncbi:MAG TPA: indole-3-glycerol phosphate synthase TrpC [Gemmatimonadales bacterium]|jgi:indole-3-glycerol phosphate synthase|nr:indole-3-glycerol phosphate synthase TrpC [Gemmatimonadales bacterium]